MKAINYLFIILSIGLISCQKWEYDYNEPPQNQQPPAQPEEPQFTPDVTYPEGDSHLIDLSSNLQSLSPEEEARAVELLKDLTFEKGMRLKDPTEGQTIYVDFFNFGYANAQESSAIWNIAQWGSKYDLKGATLKTDPNDNSRYYENSAKKISVNKNGTFTLEVNGYTEYGDTPRPIGTSWAHLYIEQKIYEAPNSQQIKFKDCDKIFFTLEGKRNYCDNYMGQAWDPQKYTGHVVCNIHLQVRNPNSPFHGKYLIIHPGIYDYRYDFPKAINAVDGGGKPTFTGMLMYSYAADRFWNGTLKSGKWQKISYDFKPMMEEGIAVWTQEGGDFEGLSLDDLYIASFGFGWEMSGTLNGSCTFRNLSLKAVLKNP